MAHVAGRFPRTGNILCANASAIRTLVYGSGISTFANLPILLKGELEAEANEIYDVIAEKFGNEVARVAVRRRRNAAQAVYTSWCECRIEKTPIQVKLPRSNEADYAYYPARGPRHGKQWQDWPNFYTISIQFSVHDDTIPQI